MPRIRKTIKIHGLDHACSPELTSFPNFGRVWAANDYSADSSIIVKIVVLDFLQEMETTDKI